MLIFRNPKINKIKSQSKNNSKRKEKQFPNLWKQKKKSKRNPIFSTFHQIFSME